ncbi:DUF3108 domain-containing protein [Olivibacter domesticus]|uniref:DUF3108 domain-containing protein n=1 Tax=Olivibacter domesticus TaxID=407022 RepID=A0A1H7RXE9_OLID1|nr:DUF3108 domain-containing protein [Olivibacter domesticus]SEL64748.1 Protein of unknown function [Olivibacter domesticus]
MKKTAFIFLLIIAQQYVAFSQTVPYLKNGVFEPGEELTYRLRYGFISAAEGVLKVLPSDLVFDNKPTYHLNAVGKTSKAFSVFYNIRDQYDSYIDQKTYLPYFFSENIKEGKYRRNDKIRFYQEKKKIEATRGNFDAKESQTFDLLSAYYFSRTLDLSGVKEGESFKLSYFLKDTLSYLYITYLGKENIKTPLGTLRCLRFSPSLEPGRVFKKDSKLHLWVTDDENRIPVKAQVDILIGAVTLELTGVKGLKYPLKKVK